MTIHPLFHLVILIVFCPLIQAEELSEADKVRKLIDPVGKPPPKPEQLSKEVVDLGRKLFFDRRLSKNGKRSCNDCHDLSRYGTNGDAVKLALKEKTLWRDVPSLYNSAHLLYFNWGGEAQTLKQATETSLTHGEQMGEATKEEVAQRVDAIGDYQTSFPESGPSFDAIVTALETFLKGLKTYAPIDRFLDGDDTALNDRQLQGAKLFDQYACSSCHTGRGFGGQMLQKAGIASPWPNQKDQGNYETSKDPKYKMVFKVPSLRNVTETSPYFHDYSSKSLNRAVYNMGFYEMGNPPSLKEVSLIVDFLESMTGELPEEYIKPPKFD